MILYIKKGSITQVIYNHFKLSFSSLASTLNHHCKTPKSLDLSKSFPSLDNDYQ